MVKITSELGKLIIKQYISGSSTVHLSIIYGMSKGAIWKYLKKNNIPIRTISESMKGKHRSEEAKKKQSNSLKGKYIGNKNGMFGRVGESASNWKGGITPLNHQIRTSSKYSNWRTQVFGRDNFTCQDCGVRGSWLEVHHKKRFSNIIKDNNITTFESAMECSELWNLNNDVTLCKECHYDIPEEQK